MKVKQRTRVRGRVWSRIRCDYSSHVFYLFPSPLTLSSFTTSIPSSLWWELLCCLWIEQNVKEGKGQLRTSGNKTGMRVDGVREEEVAAAVWLSLPLSCSPHNLYWIWEELPLPSSTPTHTHTPQLCRLENKEVQSELKEASEEYGISFHLHHYDMRLDTRACVRIIAVNIDLWKP